MFNSVDGKGFSDAFAEIRGLMNDMSWFWLTFLLIILILGLYYLHIQDKKNELEAETEKMKITQTVDARSTDEGLPNESASIAQSSKSQ